VARSRSVLIGLIICALLGIADIVGVVGAGADDGPPVAVVIIGAVLGVVSLYGVRLAWTSWPRGRVLIVVTRVLSALLGVPAFFADDAPDWAPAFVGVSILLTIIGVALLYAEGRRTVAA
jgi:FtsH-binding integral membrane protein